MLHNDVRVESVPLLEALTRFYIYLSDFKAKCILAAHNCKFDCTCLLKSIEELGMIDHYKLLVYDLFTS